MSPTSDAQVRARWRRVGTIAHHAGSDDTDSDSDIIADTPEEVAKLKERKKKQKKVRNIGLVNMNPRKLGIGLWKPRTFTDGFRLSVCSKETSMPR